MEQVLSFCNSIYKINYRLIEISEEPPGDVLFLFVCFQAFFHEFITAVLITLISCLTSIYCISNCFQFVFNLTLWEISWRKFCVRKILKFSKTFRRPKMFVWNFNCLLHTQQKLYQVFKCTFKSFFHTFSITET